jgi:hypothetical protein
MELSTESKVYTVNPAQPSAFFALYPNPTPGNTILHFSLPEEGSLRVVVYDAIGQRVLNQTVHYGSGETQYILPTARLLPGIYFVTVKMDGFGGVSKRLVRK